MNLNFTNIIYNDLIIKQRYKKLCLQYHPDKYSGNPDVFISIKESYNAIMEFLRSELYKIDEEFVEDIIKSENNKNNLKKLKNMKNTLKNSKRKKNNSINNYENLDTFLYLPKNFEGCFMIDIFTLNKGETKKEKKKFYIYKDTKFLEGDKINNNIMFIVIVRY